MISPLKENPRQLGWEGEQKNRCLVGGGKWGPIPNQKKDEHNEREKYWVNQQGDCLVGENGESEQHGHVKWQFVDQRPGKEEVD